MNKRPPHVSPSSFWKRWEHELEESERELADISETLRKLEEDEDHYDDRIMIGFILLAFLVVVGVIIYVTYQAI